MQTIKSQSRRSQDQALTYGVVLWAIAILALSACFILLTAYHKLLWSDEVLEFLCDTKPSIGQTIYDQVHRAFSLDPPAFHVFLFPLLKLFPHHPVFAIRLPSFLSFLALQACAFRITYRLTGKQNAALVAMAVPFALVTADYASEGRVYEVWALMLALAIVFYQTAIDPERANRTPALIGLLIALSLLILLHYYGIFFGLTLVAGEVYRWWRRRQFDWPVLLVIVAAYGCFALDLPAMHSLREVQAYYFADQVSWAHAKDSLLFFPLRYGVTSEIPHVHTKFAILYGFASLGMLIAIWRREWIRSTDVSRTAMLVALTTTAVLPQLIFLFSHFVSHAYSPRYALPASIGLSVMAALFVSPWIDRGKSVVVLLLFVMAFGMAFSLRLTRLDMKVNEQLTLDLHDTQDLTKALAAQPDHQLYIQSAAGLVVRWFYADPALRSGLVDVYSKEREIAWMRRAASSIFMHHMGETTSLPTVKYEDLKRRRGDHVFLVFHDPAE